MKASQTATASRSYLPALRSGACVNVYLCVWHPDSQEMRMTKMMTMMNHTNMCSSLRDANLTNNRHWRL